MTKLKVQVIAVYFAEASFIVNINIISHNWDLRMAFAATEKFRKMKNMVEVHVRNKI